MQAVVHRDGVRLRFKCSAGAFSPASCFALPTLHRPPSGGHGDLSSELLVWYYPPCRHVSTENIETNGFVTRHMFKVIRRINKLLVFFMALTISATAIGCAESTFQLASDSRLPKWITLPPGLSRADVSITMSYYVMPWGSTATFILQNKKGQTLKEVDGKDKGLEPLQLEHPPPGFPEGYPAYEIITVNGITEIIEHRKPEPIFYITDDPAVWNELRVKQK